MPVLGKLCVRDLNREQLTGKRWLVRADLNGLTPARVEATANTIRFLRDLGALVTIISHNGKPQIKGRDGLSLQDSVQLLLSALENESMLFVDDCVGQAVKDASTQDNPLLLLENTRFYADDEKGDSEFAQRLINDSAAVGVVEDGFSVFHRNHASVTGIARVMKASGGLVALGLTPAHELEALSELRDNTQHPFVGFFGGAKVGGKDGKIGLLQALAGNLDRVVIGGALLDPILRVMGARLGPNPLGTKGEDLAAEIQAAREIIGVFGNKMIVPDQLIFASPVNAGDVFKTDWRNEARMRQVRERGLVIKDVTPGQIALAFAKIRDWHSNVATVLHNGDFGDTKGGFVAGEDALLRAIAGLTDCGAKTFLGGGDTGKAVAAVQKRLNVGLNFTHVSTGGGAMIAYLIKGSNLPGLAVCSDVG